MKGMTTIVKTVTRLMTLLIFLFGIYIVTFGHSGPGGGFAGGVILASAFILIMLAFGRDRAVKCFPPTLAQSLGCIGALGFIGIALVGMWQKDGTFFWNFLHQKNPHFIESGNIAVAEFCIGIIVAALTYFIILSLASFKPPTPSEDQSHQD